MVAEYAIYPLVAKRFFETIESRMESDDRQNQEANPNFKPHADITGGFLRPQEVPGDDPFTVGGHVAGTTLPQPVGPIVPLDIAAPREDGEVIQQQFDGHASQYTADLLVEEMLASLDLEGWKPPHLIVTTTWPGWRQLPIHPEQEKTYPSNSSLS